MKAECFSSKSVSLLALLLDILLIIICSFASVVLDMSSTPKIGIMNLFRSINTTMIQDKITIERLSRDRDRLVEECHKAETTASAATTEFASMRDILAAKFALVVNSKKQHIKELMMQQQDHSASEPVSKKKKAKVSEKKKKVSGGRKRKKDIEEDAESEATEEDDANEYQDTDEEEVASVHADDSDGDEVGDLDEFMNSKRGVSPPRRVLKRMKRGNKIHDDDNDKIDDSIYISPALSDRRRRKGAKVQEVSDDDVIESNKMEDSIKEETLAKSSQSQAKATQDHKKEEVMDIDDDIFNLL